MADMNRGKQSMPSVHLRIGLELVPIEVHDLDLRINKNEDVLTVLDQGQLPRSLDHQSIGVSFDTLLAYS